MQFSYVCAGFFLAMCVVWVVLGVVACVSFPFSSGSRFYSPVGSISHSLSVVPIK